MNNDFEKNEKKITQLVMATEGLSPDAIKTIIHTAAKKCVLQDKDELTYAQIILELFIYLTPDSFTEKKALEFMVSNLVSQKDIADALALSMRRVHSMYSEVKIDGH